MNCRKIPLDVYSALFKTETTIIYSKRCLQYTTTWNLCVGRTTQCRQNSAWYTNDSL